MNNDRTGSAPNTDPATDLPFVSNEQPERAAEYLRLTLQQLARRKAPPIPLNYALGYFYSAGVDLRLNEKMDELFDSGRPWDHETAVRLFLQFLAPSEDDPSNELQQKLLDVVTEVVQSALGVANSVSQQSDSLERHTKKLAACRDPSQALAIASEILREAHQLSTKSQSLAAGMKASVGEVERLKEELAHARREASSDALTGLNNRRIFDSVLADLIDRGEPFSLIMMDIDHFKRINDEHGHLIGDRVLRQLAKLIAGRVRSSDCVARFGGEEFAIVLPRVQLNGGRRVAEKMRQGISELRMKRSDDNIHLGKVTASFGVAEYRLGEDADAFVARVDKALYLAKHNGRDRVELSR